MKDKRMDGRQKFTRTTAVAVASDGASWVSRCLR